MSMRALLAVVSYDSEIELEHAVKILYRGGFDMTRVCVVGLASAALSSALWSALSAILVVTALVYVPGTEPVVVLGWLASAFVPDLRGAAPLAQALRALGVPPGAALAYEREISAHSLLLVARVDAPGMRSLRDLLQIAELRTFESP
jgi:hypothetical protein